MYGRSFEDIDGHIWEIGYMDESKMPEEMKRRKYIMKMDPVVHFEMPAEDRKRMSGFYKNAFGWKTNQLGLKWESMSLLLQQKSMKT